MRFKVDDDMPRRVVPLLTSYGHDVTTVVDEGLGGSDHPPVAQAAAEEGRMLLTMDRRFADIRRHPPGQHPGMLVMRLHDQRPLIVETTLRAFLDQYNLEDMVGCIVIAEPGQVRVRRPGTDS